MENTLNPLTPQKKVLLARSLHQESVLKELSPQVMTVISSNIGKIKL